MIYDLTEETRIMKVRKGSLRLFVDNKSVGVVRMVRGSDKGKTLDGDEIS